MFCSLQNGRAGARRASGLVKRDHWNLVDEIASGRREWSKKFWSLLRQQNDRGMVPPLRVLGTDDMYIVDSSLKAEGLNDFFAGVFSPADGMIITSNASPASASITQPTILDAIQRIRNKSSSGGYLVTPN